MILVTRHPTINVTPETLQQLYTELPTIECQQKCQWYCRNIAMSGTEFDLIRERLGFTPRSDPVNPDPCPMLKNGLCSVYDLRPLICRLWSLTETMQCPWGCRPQPRYLTEEEAFAFLLRTGALGQLREKEEAEKLARLFTGGKP